MADEPIVFGPKAVEQIANTVREVSRMLQNPGASRGRWTNGERRYQGKLDAALAVATTFNDDPSTATFSVWERDENGDMVETAMNLTVTNRCLYLSYTTGTICKVEFIDGEWQIYAADCEAV